MASQKNVKSKKNGSPRTKANGIDTNNCKGCVNESGIPSSQTLHALDMTQQ